MNKKLGRLLRPGMGVYITFMLVYSIAAFLLNEYVLAIAELSVTVLLLVIYLLYRNRRNRELQVFVQKAMDEINDTQGVRAPFPLIVVNLSDETVVHANDEFIQLTGFHNAMSEKDIQAVLPGFNTQWLSSGKNECPYDVTIGDRRYRVYGTVIRGDDPMNTMLGALYFTDLTELYQVRDEYIRSRPVVSIILVDNYEELTRNLTEGAISALNAKLNDAITKWTENYHGLLRRLEKNRFCRCKNSA